MRLTSGVLSNVSVVITFHFQEEHLSFVGLKTENSIIVIVIPFLIFAYVSLGDEMLIKKLKDIIAEAREFSLNLLLVVLEELNVLRSLGLFLLLDGRNSSPSSSSRSNRVLVCD